MVLLSDAKLRERGKIADSVWPSGDRWEAASLGICLPSETDEKLILLKNNSTQWTDSEGMVSRKTITALLVWMFENQKDDRFIISVLEASFGYCHPVKVLLLRAMETVRNSLMRLPIHELHGFARNKAIFASHVEAVATTPLRQLMFLQKTFEKIVNQSVLPPNAIPEIDLSVLKLCGIVEDENRSTEQNYYASRLCALNLTCTVTPTIRSYIVSEVDSNDHPWLRFMLQPHSLLKAIKKHKRFTRRVKQKRGMMKSPTNNNVKIINSTKGLVATEQSIEVSHRDDSNELNTLEDSNPITAIPDDCTLNPVTKTIAVIKPARTPRNQNVKNWGSSKQREARGSVAEIVDADEFVPSPRGADGPDLYESNTPVNSDTAKTIQPELAHHLPPTRNNQTHQYLFAASPKGAVLSRDSDIVVVPHQIESHIEVLSNVGSPTSADRLVVEEQLASRLPQKVLSTYQIPVRFGTVSDVVEGGSSPSQFSCGSSIGSKVPIPDAVVMKTKRNVLSSGQGNIRELRVETDHASPLHSIYNEKIPLQSPTALNVHRNVMSYRHAPPQYHREADEVSPTTSTSEIINKVPIDYVVASNIPRKVLSSYQSPVLYSEVDEIIPAGSLTMSGVQSPLRSPSEVRGASTAPFKAISSQVTGRVSVLIESDAVSPDTSTIIQSNSQPCVSQKRVVEEQPPAESGQAARYIFASPSASTRKKNFFSEFEEISVPNSPVAEPESIIKTPRVVTSPVSHQGGRLAAGQCYMPQHHQQHVQNKKSPNFNNNDSDFINSQSSAQGLTSENMTLISDYRQPTLDINKSPVSQMSNFTKTSIIDVVENSVKIENESYLASPIASHSSPKLDNPLPVYRSPASFLAASSHKGVVLASKIPKGIKLVDSEIVQPDVSSPVSSLTVNKKTNDNNNVVVSPGSDTRFNSSESEDDEESRYPMREIHVEEPVDDFISVPQKPVTPQPRITRHVSTPVVFDSRDLITDGRFVSSLRNRVSPKVRSNKLSDNRRSSAAIAISRAWHGHRGRIKARDRRNQIFGRNSPPAPTRDRISSPSGGEPIYHQARVYQRHHLPSQGSHRSPDRIHRPSGRRRVPIGGRKPFY